jgi:hypothetical protein
MTALHDLTIKAIRRAQSQGGVIDPVEDWAAISELDRLARAATEPPTEDKLLFLDLPVIVGNLHLYRLSWGALDWVADCAGVWYANDGRMYDRALAWAHVNARSKRAFHRCAAVREATAEISRWSRDQTASCTAIMLAVDVLMREFKKRGNEKSNAATESRGDGPIFDFLKETYKQPIDYFLWEISAQELRAIIRAHFVKAEALKATLDSEAGRAPDPESSTTRHTIAFQRAAKQLIAKWCHHE